jgi:hypothetical protein
MSLGVMAIQHQLGNDSAHRQSPGENLGNGLGGNVGVYLAKNIVIWASLATKSTGDATS